MKIVAFSDTHGKHEQLEIPSGDVLIFAGDSNVASKNKFEKWIEWFKSHSHPIKIFIAGNHDWFYEKQISNMIRYFDNHEVNYRPKDTIYTEGLFYLENNSVTINVPVISGDGEIDNILKIYGTPYTPTFYNWAFMADEDKLEYIYSNIPNDTDILVTHGPAKYTLDLNRFRESRGSKALLYKIMNDLNLKAHIFGHIHPTYEIDRQSGVSRNVGVLNEDYNLVWKPTIIEL
jgi:Icc-related predicted phosphoesterase